MGSRRKDRVASFIKDEMSRAIIFELKDPRIGFATVTDVEVSGDLRYAKVSVSIMGEEKVQEKSIRAIRHAGGFLQKRLARTMASRTVPELSFELDDSVKKSIRISRKLKGLQENE